MRIKMAKYVKTILLVFLIILTSYAINGQASSDTDQYPRRGEGGGGISGFVITNLHYHLGEEPSLIKAVDFDLDGPAARVEVSFDSPASQAFSCRNTSSFQWSCDLDQVKTGEVTEIWVSATG
jgi:hypothetical protein